MNKQLFILVFLFCLCQLSKTAFCQKQSKQSEQISPAKLEQVKKEIKNVANEMIQEVGKTKLSKNQKFLNLLQEAQNAEHWSKKKLVDFGVKLKKYTTAQANAYKKVNPLGPRVSRPGYEGTCTQQYDQCVNEHGCCADCWICPCCIPCSIIYGKCILF